MAATDHAVAAAAQERAGLPGRRAAFDHTTLTLRNRQFTPPSAASGPASVGEGGTATYEVTLDRSPSVGVDVDWAVAGTGDDAADAADFVGGLPSGTVRFASGTTDLTRTFTDTLPDTSVPSSDATYRHRLGFRVRHLRAQVPTCGVIY